MKISQCLGVLDCSPNAYRSLRFFHEMHTKNQRFTFLANKANLPSLEKYEYAPGHRISRDGVITISKRMKRYGAVRAVDKYFVKRFGFYANIYRVDYHFGQFILYLSEALNKYHQAAVARGGGVA
jgi:hypothetical protein